MALYDYPLTTFRDVVEQVLDGVVGGDRSERNQRSARRAVLEAYRDLPNARAWRYFRRRVLIATVAPHTTGTLSYDHTGGAFERLVTFSSATLPTNARYYKLKIGDVVYDVEDRKSASTLTLPEAYNPGDDVAAGTSYTLYRDTYPLPFDFGEIGELIDANTKRQLDYCDAEDLLLETTTLGTTQEPYLFVVGHSPSFRGGLAIQFSPPPNAARNYVAMCQLKPRPLAEELHQEGTVTIAALTPTVVTGAGTYFVSRHAGMVFRVTSDTNNPPTPLAGSIDGHHTPFEHQSIVKSYDSATQLTLETAAPSAIAAGSKYTLSDPIDLEAGAMLTYFQRLAEAKFARIENRKDADKREAVAERELVKAAWADMRRPGLEQTVEPFASLAEMAAEVDPA